MERTDKRNLANRLMHLGASARDVSRVVGVISDEGDAQPSRLIERPRDQVHAGMRKRPAASAVTAMQCSLRWCPCPNIELPSPATLATTTAPSSGSPLTASTTLPVMSGISGTAAEADPIANTKASGILFHACRCTTPSLLRFGAQRVWYMPNVRCEARCARAR